MPELPTDFYDFKILQRVGSKIGSLRKIDTCTSATTRGKYARICIKVPLEKPLKTHVFIGNHQQQILYEGLNMLCTRCGRLDNNKNLCTFVPHTQTHSPPPTHTHTTQGNVPTPPLKTQKTTTPTKDGGWKTVTFPQRESKSEQPKVGTQPLPRSRG